MAYFKAGLGPSPNGSRKAGKQPPVNNAPPLQKPLFGVELAGGPLEKAAPPAGPAKGRYFAPRPDRPPEQNPAPADTCPLCMAALEEKAGLYLCQGRCGTTWLRNASGRLTDLAALPYGVCTCCRPPQALVPGEWGAVCPASGRDYLLTASGPRARSEASPYGLCQCCQPPMPLLAQDDTLVCQAKPYHQYERRGKQVVLISPGPTPGSQTEILDAIDDALRRNSAQLTVNGLFDLE
jgi:hypothetical protein